MKAEYWHIFSGIIPREYRADLKHVLLRDTAEIYGFWIAIDPDNIRGNTLMLSRNMGSYTPSLKYPLIHEFEHILTLNKDQVKRDETVILSRN